MDTINSKNDNILSDCSVSANHNVPSYIPKLQAILVEMLKVLDDVCQKLDIEYYICSGTCLGAMRHGGFIPWDDDVDVDMRLEDYQRFLVEAPAILPQGYSLHTWEDTKGMYAFWATLFKDGTRFLDANHIGSECNQAIFIDIFPLVLLDDNEAIATRQRRRMRFWQGLSYVHSVPRLTGVSDVVDTLAPAAHQLLKHVPQRFLAHEFWRSCKTDNPGNMTINPSYAGGKPVPIDLVFPTKRIMFEGIEVSGPANPEEYLTVKYGNWRQLPPPEKRHTHTPEILDFGDGVNVVEKE